MPLACGGAGCPPCQQLVQHLLGGSKISVCGQERGDVAEVSVQEGGQQVFRSLLQQLRPLGPHHAGPVALPGRGLSSLRWDRGDMRSSLRSPGGLGVGAQSKPTVDRRSKGPGWFRGFGVRCLVSAEVMIRAS